MNSLVRKTLIVAGIAAGIVGAAACSSSKSEPDLPPGTCLENKNCPEGLACVNQRCQDIYHKRIDIKNY